MNETGVQYFIKLFNKTWLMIVESKKSTNQQTLNTLMPGTPLIEIFFGVNTLRLGGLQLFIFNFQAQQDDKMGNISCDAKMIAYKITM